MTLQTASPGRQLGLLTATVVAMLLCLVSICFAIPYLLAFRHARLVETSWSRFETDKGGPFMAGSAALLEDGGVVYSTPLQGRGDIVVQHRESISSVVASIDRTEILPSLSAAGTQLVFVREYESRATIWIADVSGTNARQITIPPPLGRDYFPRFVASDRRIRFQRWSTTSGNASTGELREAILATGKDVLLESNCEDVSADGQLMCWLAPPKLQVTISNRDGSNPRTLGDGGYPRFSPDGRHVAFVGTWRDRGLYLADVNTGEVRKLCSFSGYPSPPQFSPDGKRIAITWEIDGEAAFWLVDTPTGQVVEEHPLQLYRTNADRSMVGSAE